MCGEDSVQYRDMQQTGQHHLAMISEREMEACSGDGRYYELSAGAPPAGQYNPSSTYSSV